MSTSNDPLLELIQLNEKQIASIKEDRKKAHVELRIEKIRRSILGSNLSFFEKSNLIKFYSDPNNLHRFKDEPHKELMSVECRGLPQTGRISRANRDLSLLKRCLRKLYLARAATRGIPYGRVERKSRSIPDLVAIESIASANPKMSWAKPIGAWVNGAVFHLERCDGKRV